MINAAEAKKQSMALYTTTEMGKIEKRITKAISKGEFEIELMELSKDTKAELVKLGYKVKLHTGTSRYDDVDTYIVSWY